MTESPRPLVSIAMCTFNGAPYLEEQLASLLRQSVQPDEMVVCDDGSSDGTLDILTSFDARAPFPVRIICNPDSLGVLRNFEKALGFCNGQYVLPADQDDVWMETKIERLLAAIKHHERKGETIQPCLVFSDLELVDATLNRIHPSFFRSMGFHKRMIGFAPLLVENIAPGCASIINRKLLDLALPIPKDSTIVGMHDWWLALCAAAAGVVGSIDTPLVQYRQHGANAVGAESAGQKPAARKSPSRIPKSERALRKIDRAVRRARLTKARLETVSNCAAPQYSSTAYAELASLSTLERIKLICKFPIWRRTIIKTLRLAARLAIWRPDRGCIK